MVPFARHAAPLGVCRDGQAVVWLVDQREHDPVLESVPLRE